MLKNKSYKVHASHQMITSVAEISALIGQFYFYDLKFGDDNQIAQIAVEKLIYKKNGRITEENAIAFLQKMNTWKAGSVDHFIEAARLLFGDDRLQFKRVDVSHKVSYGGFSKLAELTNSPPESSFIFQLIASNDYHPLIRCCLFTWIMLKHPIFDDNNVNILMAGLWQNIILLEWKPILYHVLVMDSFWVKDLISDRNFSVIRLSNDPSEFIEFNLDVILKMLKGIIEHQDLLFVGKINKLQNGQGKTEQVTVSSTVDGHHESVEVCDPVVNSSRIEIQDSGVIINKELPLNVQSLISKMLEGQEYSINDLLALIDMKHRGNFSKNYLGLALDLNLIKMTVPDKPTSKNQRYMINSDIDQ